MQDQNGPRITQVVKKPVDAARRHTEKSMERKSPASSSHSTANNLDLEKTVTGISIGRFTLRGEDDDLPQSWWFASTAIPLVAATLGPLANVLSIAALVSQWKLDLPNNGELPEGADANGIPIPDPKWEIALNAVSLACGFIGNFFLLMNFVRRVRYIIALPMSIIFWFGACGILTGILIGMHVYVPAVGPGQTYSQGFWHGVIAAVLYWIGSIILMINMLGYFLGKYPQHFDLDDSQRTLILQTMLFFFWLAIGAAVFQRLCGFSYADALYFCDVTVLTIGFGDITSTNDAGRGFIFPYTIIGIIFLGLMINSIRKFASTMSREKVIKAHARSERARTFGRTVTSEKELRDRLGLPPRRDSDTRKPSEARRSSEARPSNASRLSDRQSRGSLAQYGRFEKQGKIITFHEHKQTSHHGGGRGGSGRASSIAKPLSRDEKMRARSESNTTERKRARRREKLLLLEKEKDRFDAMREIQANTRKFKQYYALSLSVLAFAVLWFAGAVVFMVAEHREQDMSYFEALYFCYVSLLTIGYGDFSPKSNVGKPFFVVWSLIAVPTMTILISDMGDTVVAAINRGTFTVAEWTVLPRAGLWHDFLEEHPQLKNWLAEYSRKRAEKKRLKAGFEIADPDMDLQTPMAIGSPLPHGVLEELAEKEPSDHDLARRLAQAIKKCAHDIHVDPPKKYAYEEWVEFTRLIRFSAKSPDEVEVEEFEEGVVEWDWIGEDSPMLADATEAEWILERLCESLNRYTRKQARHASMDSQASPQTSPNLRSRDSTSHPNIERFSFAAGDPKEEDEITAASSSSASNGEDAKASGHEHLHWQGLTGDHKQASARRSHHKDSEAVRAWEARIAKSREQAGQPSLGEVRVPVTPGRPTSPGSRT